ncbi:MAG TPA: zinc-dependent metalloprotease family protein [Flavobacteriaceae bacterium]|nr:zinc-dependent metalloprotease family protein [Flavobacteriaceae bacterium]
MRKLTLNSILVVVILLLGSHAHAQLWQKVSLNESHNLALETRNSIPTEYDIFKLDVPTFQNLVRQAPQRFSGNSSVILPLPVGDGELQNFKIYEASNFEPGLQAKYPEIRSYAGQGIDDPTAVARFSVSPYGVSVMISSGKATTVYIDSYTQDKTHYIAYNKDQLPGYNDGFQCLFEEAATNGPIPDSSEAYRNPNDGKLRTFRLALACTGEYATFHLNRQGIPSSATEEVKKAAVLSEMNVAMTRVNAVYERDVAIHMNIIDNNDLLIFLSASTDPYTNNDGGIMLNQNQTTVDQRIGSANYDIGHVFSTGGGGIAQLRSPCVNGSKARGVTGLPQPINDPFYIDYVCHEMGHQFGARHTFNNSCQGNITPATSMEPGSGSTILSYAGICPPNVKNRADGYFHAISISEIWSNISVGQAQCGVQTATNNAPPVANAGANYIIPKSTPFILEGSATDPNDPTGASLTYTWEQMNPQQGQMPPRETNAVGPMFRSLEPSSSPIRYMPSIQTVLSGQVKNTWEVVPSVARTMNFRFTVRDNHPGGGASHHGNMRVNVDGNSGPFEITSHNSASTWTIGTPETITWNVAGTDGGSVNSPNVDIYFSSDGGLTYPILIASGIPNNGSAVVYPPNLNTTTGRFMVRGSGNIFFDVNNSHITVDGIVGVQDFAFENFAVYPNPSQGIFNLKMTPAGSDLVQVSLYDLRGRLISHKSFDANVSVVEKQLDYSAVEAGVYFLVVRNGGKQATKKIIKN